MPKAGDPSSNGEAAPATLVETKETPRSVVRQTKKAPDLNPYAAVPLDDADEFSNVMWYGQESTGKTTALAHMAKLPGDGDLIIINAEAGVKKRPLRELGVDINRIKVLPPPGVELTFAYLEGLYFDAKDRLVKNPGCILGFGFDSLTEIHAKLLDDSVARGVLKAERNGKDRDRFDIDRGDWGVMMSQVTQLLRKFRDLPCHFGVTALEKDGQEDTSGDGVKEVGPALNPGLAVKVLGYMDIIIRTQAETLQTDDGPVTLVWGQTKRSAKVRAKDRENVLPMKLVEPTFDRIRAYVEGAITPGSDLGPGIHKAVREQAEARKQRLREERQAKIKQNEEKKNG